MILLVVLILGLQAVGEEQLARALEALERGRPAETLELLEPLFSRAEPPTASLLRLRASAYLELGHLENAESDLLQATAIDPREERGHRLLGMVQEKRGERVRARRSLERARELLPEDANVAATLGGLLYRSGHYEAAAEAYASALEHGGSTPMIERALSMAYLRAERFDFAAASLEKLVASGDDSPPVLESLGYAYLRKGLFEQAREYLDRAVASAPDRASAHFQLGATLAKLGRGEPARDQLHLAARDRAVAPDALLELALLDSAEGETEAALERLGDAIALRPHFAAAHYQLGTLLTRIGRSAEAQEPLSKFEELTALDDALERHRNRVLFFPDEVEGYVALAQIYQQQGQLEKALETVEQANQLAPADATLVLGRADLLRFMGRAKEAIDLLETALSSRPDDQQLLYLLGHLYWGEDRIEEAERILRRLVALAPPHAPSLSDLGLLLTRTKRVDEALSFLAAAIEADPDLAVAHLHLAEAYRAARREEEADEHMQIYLRLTGARKDQY